MGEKFLFWLVMILGVGGFVLVSLESCNDSEAKRLHAQTALTHARSQATEATLAALMPYTILGLTVIAVVLVISLAIFGLVHMANIRASQPPRPEPARQLPPPQVVHNHNYYIVMSNDDYDQLSDRQILKRLTAGRRIER